MVFRLDNRINAKAARLPEVRDAVADVARDIAAKAKSNAASHKQSGDFAASVHVVRGKVDSHVVADVDYAASAEFGHHSELSGQWVDGVFALTRAAK
ncbi:MAG: DUF5403 family protein [Stackebrandtia sp.]